MQTKVPTREAMRVVMDVGTWRGMVRSVMDELVGPGSDLAGRSGAGLFISAMQEDGVLRIDGIGSGAPTLVHVVVQSEEDLETEGTMAPPPDFEGASPIVGAWDGRLESLPTFREWEDERNAYGPPLRIDTYDVSVDVLARAAGLFETRVLSRRRVAIFGVGSLGSYFAEELVRCGVDDFVCIDFDRLEAHNVARHTCDLRDLGRFKTTAVADRIRNVNPGARVTTFEVDICKAPHIVDEVLEGVDLAAVDTDSNSSRFLVNEIATRRRIPVVYAGAYERGMGGHVLRCIPGETPCYECVVGALVSKLGELPEPRKGRIPYVGAEHENEFVAEPGLGLDVRFLALIQAKMALLTLLRGSGSTLPDFPADLVFWGNQKWWIFPEPLFAQFASTSYREECTTCRGGRPATDRDDE